MLTIRLAVESCDGSFFAKEVVDLAVGVGKEAAIARFGIGAAFLFAPGEVDPRVGINLAVENIVHKRLHDHKYGRGDASRL